MRFSSYIAGILILFLAGLQPSSAQTSKLLKEREQAFVGLMFTLAGASLGAIERRDMARLDELDVQLSAERIDAKTHLTPKTKEECTKALIALHQMVVAAKTGDRDRVKNHKDTFMTAKDRCRELAE